jgi:hypothetical protein
MELEHLGHEKFVLILSAEVGNDVKERIEELRSMIIWVMRILFYRSRQRHRRSNRRVEKNQKYNVRVSSPFQIFH